MTDFERNRDALNASTPADTAAVVTPDDGTDLPTAPCKALWIGSGGDIVVDMEVSGSAITFVGVGSGVLLPIRVNRVRATSTTAADIVALY
jgi:hypothetical protein